MSQAYFLTTVASVSSRFVSATTKTYQLKEGLNLSFEVLFKNVQNLINHIYITKISCKDNFTTSFLSFITSRSSKTTNEIL